jgi:hypothetical protein
MPAKEINSLLLYSAGKPDISAPHIARLERALPLKRYSHAIPALAKEEFSDGEIKWMFDFSDQLSDGAYDVALSKFLESHRQFILDVLSIDRDVIYYLSAQLSVDGGLAVFEIKPPRIPDDLNALPSFQFSYSVWHINAEDEAGRDGPAATLQ